jgi:ribosomal-protein-alanine N-acetyltransferase
VRLSTKRTARLRIRQLRTADRQAFVALARESRAFLAGRASPPQSARAFSSYIARSAAPDFGVFVLEMSTTRELVGAVTVSQVLRGNFHSACLGYWIGVSHANRGYMREALPLVLTELFLSCRLHRLEANVEPSNRWSKRLLKAMGFRREGYSRRFIRIHGSWRDHERWAIARDDWRGAYRR